MALIRVLLLACIAIPTVQGYSFSETIGSWIKGNEPTRYSGNPWDLIDKMKMKFLLRGVNLDGTEVMYKSFIVYWLGIFGAF